jgi:hypothetical protein
MVDANDFLKTATPRIRRSDIEPFYPELLKLKDRNCTLKVMQEFLSQNGVTVSVGAISKFIKRRVTTKEATRQLSEQPTKEKIEKPETETKLKNVTRFVDKDKLERIKNFKPEE